MLDAKQHRWKNSSNNCCWTEILLIFRMPMLMSVVHRIHSQQSTVWHGRNPFPELDQIEIERRSKNECKEEKSERQIFN